MIGSDKEGESDGNREGGSQAAAEKSDLHSPTVLVAPNLLDELDLEII